MNLDVNTVIVILTCLVSILCFNNRTLFNRLKHYPVIEASQGQYFRWLTSGFVHANYLHLFVNMFVLYQFGRVVEYDLVLHFGHVGGGVLYAITYLLTIIMADVPTFYKHRNNPSFASVGASGGVSGILLIYIMLHPWSMLGLYLVIPVPAIIFGVMYLWYSSWAAKNQGGNIDHDAHFYGAVAGVLIAIITRPSIFSEFINKLINNFPW